MKKSSLQLNARLLRILLSLLLVIIFAGASVSFAYAHKVLLSYASEISHKKADAEASNGTITKLQQVEKRLATTTEVSNKINQFRAEDSFPEFRVVDEIRAIAAKNNIPITGFSYGGSAAETATNGNTVTQQPATATTPTTPTQAAPDNKSITLTINIGSVTDYTSYLQFIYDIEQNIPKMKISGAGVSSSEQTATDGQETQSTGGISVSPITVEMYIK